MVARDGRRRSRSGSRTSAEGFNKSQSEYHVNAVYKGNYTEVMTGAIAAFRAKQQPHIVQVFEVGTATMMAAKGAIKPVYELMADAGEKFDPKAYLPAVTGYYTTADGRMLSLPLNSSTPVLYYNKDAFKKAGLDPNKPPAHVARDGRVREEAPGGGATRAASAASGSSGSCSRTTRPGTTCRSRPSRTASPASTPSSS